MRVAMSNISIDIEQIIQAAADATQSRRSTMQWPRFPGDNTEIKPTDLAEVYVTWVAVSKLKYGKC
jgi:hypothetical protein